MKNFVSFLKSSGTRSENLYFIFMMGVIIGLVIGSIRNPLWIREPDAFLILACVGVTIVCGAKIILLRLVMFLEGERDG